MTPFPMTLLVSSHDNELTPIIQRAISKFIQETAAQTYPNVPAAVIEKVYRKQHNPNYEALALLITKELKTYAKTRTSHSSGGSATSR